MPEDKVLGQPVAPSIPAEQGLNRNPDGTFPPGVSGNPNGRPKGSFSIMTIIRQKMSEIPPGQVKEWKEQIAEKILEKAIVNGDEAMLKLIVQYMDGMPNQKIDFGLDKDNLGDLTTFLSAMATKKPAEAAPTEAKPPEDGKDNKPSETA